MLYFQRKRQLRRRSSARPPRLAPAIECLEDRRLLAAAAGGLVDFSALTVETDSYDSSKILVQLRPDASSDNVTAIFGDAQVRAAAETLPGLFEVSLSPATSVDEALRHYRGHTSVLLAEPDYRIQLTTIQAPDDPSFTSLWGLNNTGQTGGTRDADIDALEAWSVTTGSSSVVVAVIDTGVDYTHPDLAANIWVNPREVPGNGIDDDGNGYIDDVHGYDFVNDDGDPRDDNGHGTHVAGTIAAVGSNGAGVIGVAPDVRIMGLKFLAEDGGGYVSDAVRALNYAVANGAQISNNSWGGGGWSRALSNAIDAARTAGHIFVAAAGNSGSDNDVRSSYPAGYSHDNVISVAATNHNDALAGFSNYGASSVDLATPGVNILSTVPGGQYATYSGTSMATPHVSGVIALVKSLHPDWTYRQIIDQVLGTVDRLDGLDGKMATGGRLNAAAAVGAAIDSGDDPGDDTAVVSVGRPTFTGPGPTTIDTTPELTWTSATGADRYQLLVYDVARGREIINEQSLTATAYTLASPLAAGQNYQAFVRGVGAGGETGQWSPALNFTVQPPGPPSLIGPGSFTYDPTPEITWIGTADSHRYEVLVYNTAAGRLAAHGTSLTSTAFTPDTPLTAGPTYQVFVRAIDDAGSAGAWSSPRYFDVRPPAAPQLTGLATGTGDTTPNITWQAAAGAHSYELLLYDTAAGRLVVPPQVLAATTFTPPTSLVAGREYEVFVRGVNDAGHAGAWSAPYEFRIGTGSAGGAMARMTTATVTMAERAGGVSPPFFSARREGLETRGAHAPRSPGLAQDAENDAGTLRADSAARLVVRQAEHPHAAGVGSAGSMGESSGGSARSESQPPLAAFGADAEVGLLDRLFAELASDSDPTLSLLGA